MWILSKNNRKFHTVSRKCKSFLLMMTIQLNHNKSILVCYRPTKFFSISNIIFTSLTPSSSRFVKIFLSSALFSPAHYVKDYVQFCVITICIFASTNMYFISMQNEQKTESEIFHVVFFLSIFIKNYADVV